MRESHHEDVERTLRGRRWAENVEDEVIVVKAVVVMSKKSRAKTVVSEGRTQVEERTAAWVVDMLRQVPGDAGFGSGTASS